QWRAGDEVGDAAADTLLHRATATPLAAREQRGRDAVEDRRMADLVDEPEPAGARRRHSAAGEDQVQRRRHADQARQPLRAAEAGDQAELHLGEAELRLLVLAGQAPVAAERELEAAAE